MAKYCVNDESTSPTGEHEVHKDGCHMWPAKNRDLGYHADCKSAVTAAKKIYANSDGCGICSPDCHKK